MKTHHVVLSSQPEDNVTAITEVKLLGFNVATNVRIILFIFFFVIFCVTVCGNLLIMALVTYSKDLQSPMYFFLTQLSMSDILLSSDVVPNMLRIDLSVDGVMSFRDCLSQFYFFVIAESSESLLLTIMSYDRYLAICKPLYYNSIMDVGLCRKLIGASWFFSICVALIDTTTLSLLTFCGPNVVDHYFCDYSPIAKLSCSDTSLNDLENVLLSIPMVLTPVILISVSYSNIIHSILKISSISGRQKAFSTCSAHLTVVFLFYGSIFCTYVLPNMGKSTNTSKVLSILYTVGTPFLNPIIYSLRNKEIKKAFKKSIKVLKM